MSATVTVLLAAYNSEGYIGELLDSLLGQTYEDFRILVCDDLSKDKTRRIIDSYAAKDERVRVFEAGTQSGGAQNNFFRLLLACPDSDYIMFCDDDDVWLPHKIKTTLEHMQELEGEYGKSTPLLVHGDVSVVDDKLNVIAKSLFEYEGLSCERTSLRELLAQNNITGCTVMINRALRNLIHEQPESSVMHDWWLGLCASAFGKIGVIKEPLMLYRQHGDNQVGAYNASSFGDSLKRLFNNERNKKIYSQMFAQAKCFADTFENKLSQDDLALCRAYASLADKNKLARIATLVKYRFFKNTLQRNIGQFIAI